MLLAATTIVPTADIQHILGSALVETITLPTGVGAGWEFTLIPDSEQASFTATIGSTSTSSIGSTSTGTSTGTSIALTSLTGFVSIGDTVSGTGITAGTTVISQTNGTPGLAGTYVLSTSGTAAAATITTFGTVLHVLSGLTGIVSIGESVSGGSGFPASATVVSQTSGTAGSTGVYVISAPATAYVASASGVTTFGEVLNVTAISSGTVEEEDVFTGSNVPSNATIVAQISGTPGSTGKYAFSPTATQYVASESMAIAGNGTETGGNIALASTFVQGKALILTYDGTSFYPSY